MKKLIILLFIPLLIACNSNKNKYSNSDYSLAATVAGTKKVELKNYYGALIDFDAAISLDPFNERAFAGRGTSYLLLKDYEKAIKNFDIAIAYDSTYLSAYFYKGIAHLMLDDIKEACKTWEITNKIGDKDSRNKWKKNGA